MTEPALRIGLVLDDSLDPVDGVQQHVLTLGKWLSAQGHAVSYIAAETVRDDIPGLVVLGKRLSVRFNGNRLGTPLPVPRRRARTLLGRLGLDVLHIAMPYSPMLAGRLVSQASSRTAVVGTFHILPLTRLVDVGAHGLGLLQRRQLRRFDRFIAVSQPAAEFARAAFKFDADVIGNPVDVKALRLQADGAADSVDGASDPGGTDAPVRIVFLGRLVERKGPRELVAAYLRARTLTDVDMELVVAGRGPLLDELQAEASSDASVSFPGFIAEEDKAGLLAGADVIALPSTGGESFGISVVEALAVGSGPVLAGDNPGYRSVMAGLEDQVIDPAETDGFAAQLVAWAESSERRAAVVERQKAQADRFDIEAIGPQVVERYKAALAERR